MMTDALPASLDEARREIEALDRRIVALIAERVRHARRIGRLKREAGQPLLDPAREAAIIRRAADAARDEGIDPEAVRQLFWTLVGLCRRAQEQP